MNNVNHPAKVGYLFALLGGTILSFDTVFIRAQDVFSFNIKEFIIFIFNWYVSVNNESCSGKIIVIIYNPETVRYRVNSTLKPKTC
ncbi:hypothetical protein SAMN05421784_12254 [Xenorhabdus koppenhoeferi]|uniref:Uncharacterized protein n=1 Tax=Xenorhabdus koppenhoeferi TaxID=351659 RepID=A0A1I7IQB3_9GAMM|nr:hypothetical protein SAMN05421784_12254 [Xenorhabdus koppenhoeferi]